MYRKGNIIILLTRVTVTIPAIPKIKSLQTFKISIKHILTIGHASFFKCDIYKHRKKYPVADRQFFIIDTSEIDCQIFFRIFIQRIPQYVRSKQHPVSYGCHLNKSLIKGSAISPVTFRRRIRTFTESFTVNFSIFVRKPGIFTGCPCFRIPGFHCSPHRNKPPQRS